MWLKVYCICGNLISILKNECFSIYLKIVKMII